MVPIRIQKGSIYCLHDVENGICRIGQTTTPGNKRQKAQMGYYPFELHLYSFDVTCTTHAERYFHNHFKELRKKGDWFFINPDMFFELQAPYQEFFKKEYAEMDEWDRAMMLHCYHDGELLKLKEKNTL